MLINNLPGASAPGTADLPQTFGFNRQPPARLLAATRLNMAGERRALIAWPSRYRPCGRVLLSTGGDDVVGIGIIPLPR
jgi:hypothetical protein